MNRQRVILFAVALLLIGGTAALLAPMKANRKQGRPGVKTVPLANSGNLEVVLPEHVLNFTSQVKTQDALVVGTLPPDTSYGQRIYTAPDGFWSQVNVVLMGSDRTSLHKPQFCLEGAGWNIDANSSATTTVPVKQPHEYDLPVIKLIANRAPDESGQLWRGIYVYWFVAEDEISADMSGFNRLWSSSRKLLATGVQQRWAYVSFFTVCRPGMEEIAFERVKELIAATVPEFQLTP